MRDCINFVVKAVQELLFFASRRWRGFVSSLEKMARLYPSRHFHFPRVVFKNLNTRNPLYHLGFMRRDPRVLASAASRHAASMLQRKARAPSEGPPPRFARSDTSRAQIQQFSTRLIPSDRLLLADRDPKLLVPEGRFLADLPRSQKIALYAVCLRHDLWLTASMRRFFQGVVGPPRPLPEGRRIRATKKRPDLRAYQPINKLPVLRGPVEEPRGMGMGHGWARAKKVSWFLENKWREFEKQREELGGGAPPARPEWLPPSNWELLVFLSGQLPRSFPGLLYNVTTEITTWRRFSNEFMPWPSSADARFPSDWNRLLKMQKILLWLVFKPELLARHSSFFLPETQPDLLAIPPLGIEAHARRPSWNGRATLLFHAPGAPTSRLRLLAANATVEIISLSLSAPLPELKEALFAASRS